MKRILFEKIELQNFLSFGDTPAQVTFKNGITFISGDNLDDKDSKNGVGKTALILESLSFVLFGECYREINQATIPNDRTKGDCIVQLWFSVNDDKYHVVRSLKPSVLKLSKNGSPIERTIKETGKDIIDILGISKEVFTNIIVMTNRDSDPFLEQGSTFKAKFIEGILGLEIFNPMYETANNDLKAQKKLVESTKVKLDTLNQNLIVDKRYATEDDAKRIKGLVQIDTDIEKLLAVQEEDHSSEIINIQQTIIDLHTSRNTIEDKIQKARIKKSGLEAEYKGKKEILRKLQDIRLDCPTCKRPLGEHNADEIEKEKQDAAIEIEKSKIEIEKYNSAIAKATQNSKTILDSIEENEDKLETLQLSQEKFSISQQKIQLLQQQRHLLENSRNPFLDKIVKSEEDIKILSETYTNYLEEQTLFDAVKHVLSPTGVKTVAVKRIIDTFNDRLKYYCERLNVPCAIEFDEFFEEKVTTHKGKKFTYGNLSGGEAKRADVALMFTFRDIRRLQSSIFINVSVFDEIFDSALDQKGMMAILALLKESAEDNHEAFYIISHRPENIEVEDCDIIHIIKKNGISSIK